MINIFIPEGYIVFIFGLECSFVIMPSTLKKLKGHIALGLSVCASVCACARPLQVQDRVLKFHGWTQHQKIPEQYFF